MPDDFPKNHFFVIDADHNVHPADSMWEWVRAYDEDLRVVNQTGNDNIWISTVFLGINHNFDRENGIPILFETMVFGGHWNHFQYRYHTYEEAVQGHNKVCEEVFGILKA